MHLNGILYSRLFVQVDPTAFATLVRTSVVNSRVCASEEGRHASRRGEVGMSLVM